MLAAAEKEKMIESTKGDGCSVDSISLQSAEQLASMAYNLHFGGAYHGSVMTCHRSNESESPEK